MGFIVGNRITSLMELHPVSSITQRSMPMPRPPRRLADLALRAALWAAWAVAATSATACVGFALGYGIGRLLWG